ncbi:addiction module antidote protein [Jiella sp. M17.18]|uniref:addiction module antidote protein n=1 Tax=Jiella sp. M17.18 TaxID=3234247 RepID=UPI0034DEE6CF
MTAASKPFEFEKYDHLLRDPTNAAAYLAEFLESGDLELFQEGIRHVAKAQAGGISRIADDAELSRENLYRALSRDGHPRFETVARMLAAMGLRLTIEPAGRAEPEPDQETAA